MIGHQAEAVGTKVLQALLVADLVLLDNELRILSNRQQIPKVTWAGHAIIQTQPSRGAAICNNNKIRLKIMYIVCVSDLVNNSVLVSALSAEQVQRNLYSMFRAHGSFWASEKLYLFFMKQLITIIKKSLELCPIQTNSRTVFLQLVYQRTYNLEGEKYIITRSGLSSNRDPKYIQ